MGVLAGGAMLVRAGPMARLLLLALLLPGLGFAVAALRARAVAAPVLAHEMTANLEGRVIGLDRSASERPRVLLDRVVIFGLEPGETPARVRVSLDPSTPWGSLKPGMRLIGQARLSPPAAPAEPGGFDFRRLAWFERLGAVGYARTPFVEAAGGDASGFRQLTFRLRMALSAHVRAAIPGENGAFAAAILSGDRSAIPAEVNEELRLSTLYHIVSIGGLHMSLIAAAVFAMVRYGLALVPRLALVWPLKKIAAVASLTVTLAYLAVSGFDVAAQRAFVMLAVVLSAVMLDRPALTMRSVAVAAVVILAVAPESITLAGFQMSFAGTIALVAAFEGLRGRAWWQATNERRWRLARPVLAVFVTSLVAGVATAPYSAFHFNMLGQYGLVANMLAMPAMGLVVMPAAVVALFLAPLGLDGLGFTVMGWGVGYVLAVAEWVAGPRRRGGGRAGGAGREPRADLARRAGAGALDRPRALGRAGADRGGGGALGGGRPAGPADRRRRPAVRHRDAGRAGAVGARGPRLRGGELARGRRRPREPGRGACPWRAGAAAAPDRDRRAGARAAGLCRQPRRGGGGGRMRGGGGADRAELGAGARGAVPLRRARAAGARRGAGDPDHRSRPRRRGGASVGAAVEWHPAAGRLGRAGRTNGNACPFR